MVARGPPAPRACPPGDSSNTRLLSARTNIWESVMKGLEEKEGVSQTQRTPTALQAQQEVEAAVGREVGESGLWNVRGHPHAWPPSLGPELHREAQGRGARG